MSHKHVDPPFGETVVAFLEIKMRRDGLMSIGGSITDEAAILSMIDTARATLVENFRRLKKKEDAIIVPGYDTALVGTDYEKKLLDATGQLVKAQEEAGHGR
jgi:hypothetical protein